MPRKSAASLSVVKLDPAPKAPTPRADLAPAVKALFRELVSKAPKGMFLEVDEYVLEMYCTAVHESRLAQHDMQTEGRDLDGKPSPSYLRWEKANKIAHQWGVRLRLGPKSRIDARSAKLTGRPPSAYE